MKRRYRLSILVGSFVVSIRLTAALPEGLGIETDEIARLMPPTDIRFLYLPEALQALGWAKDCSSNNLCGGYYVESANLMQHPSPKAWHAAPFEVTASQPAFFTKSGASIMQGDVKLTQPGREITADHVTFVRDNKTGKITKAFLVGHVNFRESGRLLVGAKSDLDFVHKVYNMSWGIYRVLANTPTGLANAWGRAKHIISDTPGILKLKGATYSTCPPDATTWHLWGSKLVLNQTTGRGEVVHAVLFLKNVPVFYVPYFNFPIDKRRQSGFLIPALTYSNNSGGGLDIPYYFNLAPNYDATLSPQFFTKRGVLLKGGLRYLTATSAGTINFSYIPHDNAFAKFRDTSPSSALPQDGTYHRAFTALKASSSSRGFLNFQNSSHFGEHWRSALNINYVTDDYFVQDFSGVANIIDNDQLLNRADISYADYHWNFLARLQAFQTLHPITRKTQDQYKRLPQLNLAGDFPGMWQGLDYRIDSELVNFMHRDDFYRYNSLPIVSGSRFNLTPSISKALHWLGGYVTPRVQFQATGYNVHDQVKQEVPNTLWQLHPLIALDSSIILQHKLNFLRQQYNQTLEPRVFYLFVPGRNQNRIPLFDTYLPPFDFNQLFRLNRFNGIDRVGDANHLALGVTTRLLDQWGQEKLNAGLGQIISLRKHQVTINTAESNLNVVPFNVDPLETKYLSPIVGKLQYFINSQLNSTFNFAWDPNYRHLNTLEAKLQYLINSERVINFWYNYALHGDQLDQGRPLDLSRVGVSVGWKIWHQWHIIGNLNYNLSYKRAQNYLYGIEYNSCCWAMRAVHSKNFIDIGADNKSNYDSRYYFQVMLKGVSSFDCSGLESVLANQSSGYKSKLVAGV